MNKLLITLPASTISILMLIALGDNPYSFYTFLRIATAIVMVYLAYKTYENDEKDGLVWIFGAIAILFNPFIPVYLSREVWAPIDIIVAATILITSLNLSEKIYTK